MFLPEKQIEKDSDLRKKSELWKDETSAYEWIVFVIRFILDLVVRLLHIKCNQSLHNKAWRPNCIVLI